jgi:hypothetical protein
LAKSNRPSRSIPDICAGLCFRVTEFKGSPG